MRLYRGLTGLLLLAAAAPCAGQFTPWAARSEFAPGPPGVAPAGMLGYLNPAVLARLEAAESTVAWSAGEGEDPASEWGLFTALPHLGFGVLRRAHGGEGFRDYRLGFGAGDRGASAGLAWGWSSEDGSDPVWVAGALWQPSTLWSLGAAWTAASDGGPRELAGSVGLRPLRSDRLTLYGEAVRADAAAGGDTWSAGGLVRLWEGLQLAARYREDGAVTAGLRVELGGLGLWTQSRRDRDGDRTRNLHMVRLGPNRGTVLAPLHRRRPSMVRLDLHGPVKHRVAPFFDDGRSQLSLLFALRRVERDPGLAGVSVNLSGLRLDPAMAWELRRRLQRIRQAGKRVVVYVDRADLRGYRLASAADRIVLDPVGGLGLSGFAAGQLYLRGALDKLGIGSQVWQYHEYKTGPEALTRTDMSEADREQLQALVDGAYERARADISEARGLTPEAFDQLVDEVSLFTPRLALEHGLVDTVGRWEAGEGKTLEELPPQPADEEWGAPPTVALVYALGVCAMDTGIGARRLSRELRDLAGEPGVDAVVLRVDSPGGDPLASDLVAEAIRKVSAEKPLVVSQGRWATSGGYWISMDADAIAATPETVTGNIGVWASWLYNRGFRERLGLTIDHVQAGAHADLGLGMPLPLLGSLPDRPLDEMEAARFDQALESLYDGFVHRVAEARRRTPEEVDGVARGRVWSGPEALRAGLVDTLGGLETALTMAGQRAGLAPGRRLRVVERPPLSPFSLPALADLLGGARGPAAAPFWIEWLRLRLDHNGQPLLMPPEPVLDELGPARPYR